MADTNARHSLRKQSKSFFRDNNTCWSRLSGSARPRHDAHTMQGDQEDTLLSLSLSSGGEHYPKCKQQYRMLFGLSKSSSIVLV